MDHVILMLFSLFSRWLPQAGTLVLYISIPSFFPNFHGSVYVSSEKWWTHAETSIPTTSSCTAALKMTGIRGFLRHRDATFAEAE